MVTQLDLFGNHVDVQAKDSIWILKNRPAPDPNSPIVVSYGGGTNSTALLIAMVLKGIKPDLILFADTGGELPETYEWVNTFSNWLHNQGFPSVTVVKRGKVEAVRERKALVVKWDVITKSFDWFLLSLYLGILSNGNQFFEYSNLYEKCITLKALPSRVFNKGECSINYKIKPQQSYLEGFYSDIIGGTKIRMFIGFHSEEIGRLINKKEDPFETEFYRKEYPLIEWGLNQKNCISLIESIGLGVPPKSSCFFCPNRKPSEVLFLKEKYPELYDAACFMEENFADRAKEIVGLGRTWRWLDLDKLSALEQLIIDNKQESRRCACID